MISTFLLLALVVEASAQTRTVGVSVGNKFRYDRTAHWSSNDPNATPSSSPDYARALEYNNTQWREFTVTAISGTNVTGQLTNHYKNGTEDTTGGWIDVSTGMGANLTFFLISANLTAGDSLGTYGPYNTTITETVSRTYLSGVRDTNHINSTSSDGTQTYRTNMYWDKSTGVLVGFLSETTNQTGIYITTWSGGTQIISSDVWIVPEFPSWTPALLMLIVLTSATMVIARQKQPKRPFR
ncbi:hypothetical protein MUP77_19770 [Candidatus Bathyarchaeota archaeon]|nr:hypothetical protein [Candidatus Bathyarchaeota archaeon]